jgi:Crp-like helix-turn-helix protein
MCNPVLAGFQKLMMQSTACMALHPVQDRCCRWLLMAHDRVHRDEFELSHEFLAMMLGATRPTVTLVAGTLPGTRTDSRRVPEMPGMKLTLEQVERLSGVDRSVSGSSIRW